MIMYDQCKHPFTKHQLGVTDMSTDTQTQATPPPQATVTLTLTHEELHILHNIILMEGLALARETKSFLNQRGRITPSMQLVVDRQILRVATETELVASIGAKIKEVTPVRVVIKNSTGK